MGKNATIKKDRKRSRFIEFYAEYPCKFIENFLNIKLKWYQRILIKYGSNIKDTDTFVRGRRLTDKESERMLFTEVSNAEARVDKIVRDVNKRGKIK